MRIGVLAMQGGFAAHASALSALGHRVVEIRRPRDLEGLEGLVLPGGESTVQLDLIARFELEAPLERLVERGVPVLATCAGLILAARVVRKPEQRSLGWLEVEVERNGYGTQRDSFEATADDGALPLMFIRAPRISAVGQGVEVLAKHRGEPVLVRQARIVGATFHPELTGDPRVAEMVFGDRARAAAQG